MKALSVFLIFFLSFSSLFAEIKRTGHFSLSYDGNMSLEINNNGNNLPGSNKVTLSNIKQSSTKMEKVFKGQVHGAFIEPTQEILLVNNNKFSLYKIGHDLWFNFEIDELNNIKNIVNLVYSENKESILISFLDSRKNFFTYVIELGTKPVVFDITTENSIAYSFSQDSKKIAVLTSAQEIFIYNLEKNYSQDNNKCSYKQLSFNDSLDPRFAGIKIEDIKFLSENILHLLSFINNKIITYCFNINLNTPEESKLSSIEIGVMQEDRKYNARFSLLDDKVAILSIVQQPSNNNQTFLHIYSSLTGMFYKKQRIDFFDSYEKNFLGKNFQMTESYVNQLVFSPRMLNGFEGEYSYTILK